MEGHDTLAVRWEPATTIIEAQMRSRSFDVRIMRTQWLSAGESVFNPRWPFLMMFYGENELVQAAYCSDQNRESYVRQGKFFFIPAGEKLQCQWKPGIQRGLHCMFDIEYIAARYGLTISDNQIDKTGSLHIRNEYVAATMRRISEEVCSPNADSNTLIELMLLQMAIELSQMRMTPADAGESRRLSKQDIALIRSMCLDTSLDFPTLEALASPLGLGCRQLAAAFRDTTGGTLRNFMAQARIERAKELLSDRNLMVKQVAFQAGFVSFSSFCGAFRRETGLTPAHYRARTRSPH